MTKPAVLLAASLLFFGFSWSQSVIDNSDTIYNSTMHAVGQSNDLPFFRSGADAEKIVAAVMDAVGLEASFSIQEANVPNVEAKIKYHQRCILYNPSFVEQVNEATKDKWACVFILAHEIGHHLDGHTLGDAKGRPAIELQADEFAGFALCRMGATLGQAQLAMHYIADVDASSSHPARADRLMAIQKGWEKAERQTQNAVANANN